MMIKREWRQLLEMIKFSLGKGKAPELRVETDWGKFYRICKFHKIQSMVCPGIQKLPKEQQPPEEILKKFQEAESMEIARDAVQAFSQEELLEAFEKEGISVLPLKGILMKRFYPVTSMRMMADLDILYETGRGKEVEAVLTDLGYYCDHRDSHHDVFFRKPFMNIEMHHCMIGENSLLDAYYEDIWKRARQEEGKSHIYRLSWEDFYIFMIAHMAKHFQGGGCGIRSIVDMWLFSDRMKESLDWDYVRKELEKIELAQFERCMCDLVSVWFEEKAETEFYAQLTELLMQSGIYGTITNYNIQHVAEVDKRVWKGQIKVWMEAIFLPYKASMWDSLESVWKAADADPECDAYVIPIPYYDKNPDGTLGAVHYEGDMYPDYVPITDYKTYDIEKRKPDVIFIHNPYDECNYVTSVEPRYYSKKLANYTNCLVYIPYFVIDENRKLDQIEHYVLTSAVINADVVVVQSDKVKEKYIEILNKFYRENGREVPDFSNKNFGNWFAKILML